MSKTLIAAIEAELVQTRSRVSALEAALAALTGISADKTEPKPGDRMADGTVYVGISPTNGRHLYAMPHDLPDLYTWGGAKKAAAAQTFAGHTDWRVPTKDQLQMIYRAQEAVGGFQRGWYWSSSKSASIGAWHQDFCSGYQSFGIKNVNYRYRVRCVRSG